MDQTEPEIKVNVVTSKSLYGATQLASMIGNTSSDAVLDKPNIIKTEPDLFPDSHGHFDSFLRDLSDHDMSAPKSKLKRYAHFFLFFFYQNMFLFLILGLQNS